MITVAGRVVTPTGVLEHGVVEVAGDRIVAVREDDSPQVTATPLVVPGFVDLHCHGAAGASFTSADEAEVTVAARHHLERGTTTLLASTVTDEPQRMVAAVAVLADAADRGLVTGVHIEGPFLATARCGAQDPRWLRPPDLALASELLEAGRGHVRVMTIAPELPGSAGVVDLLRSHGVVPALGHTEATATLARDHLRGGPGLVTHLFNGMPPMHHRDAGPVLGALAAAASGDGVVELIADGVHVSDETALQVLDLLGPTRVAFVTDAMAAAGMADGLYPLGPQTVRVLEGVARLVDGDSIAGGTARMVDIAVRMLRAGVAPTSVVESSSRTPAGVLGLDDRGSIAPGSRADLVVLDEGGHAERVMAAGRWVE